MHRIGASTTYIECDLRRGPWIMLLQTAKGATWLVIGASVFIFGLIAGPARRVHGRRFLAYGYGLLAGMLGHRVEEYRETDGA